MHAGVNKIALFVPLLHKNEIKTPLALPSPKSIHVIFIISIGCRNNVFKVIVYVFETILVRNYCLLRKAKKIPTPVITNNTVTNLPSCVVGVRSP